MTHKSLGEGKRYLKAAGAGERQGESAVDLRRLEPPRFGDAETPPLTGAQLRPSQTRPASFLYLALKHCSIRLSSSYL